MAHLRSGTLTSITNLATSLARNMDRLSLDEEHYTRQEEWRRQLPESLGDGLRQGLSRLGISLLGMWGCSLTHTHSPNSMTSGDEHSFPGDTLTTTCQTLMLTLPHTTSYPFNNTKLVAWWEMKFSVSIYPDFLKTWMDAWMDGTSVLCGYFS